MRPDRSMVTSIILE